MKLVRSSAIRRLPPTFASVFARSIAMRLLLGALLFFPANLLNAQDPNSDLIAAAPPLTAAPNASTAAASQPATRTAEQVKQDNIARVMEFFRLTQPDVYEQAKSLRLADAAKFDRLIMGTLPTVNRLELLRKKNQKLFDLSMRDLQLGYQSLRLSHDLKGTDLADADRKKMNVQLAAIVAEEFDVQQQIRQIEIDDLQIKIKDLDAQVKQRQTEKEAIMQKRINDLVEHSPRLDW